MADKPSRSLVIYGDGCLPAVSPSHSHLHSFASLAACGFLSLRDPPPNGPETTNDRMVRELAQLLDAYDSYKSVNEKHGESVATVDQREFALPKISESRMFMGLRAAMFTECPSIRSFASDLGFTVFQMDELIKETGSSGDLVQIATGDDMVTSEVIRLLGFSGGDVLEKYEFDLVFVHIMSTEKPKEHDEKPISSTDVDWLDKLVGKIMQTAHPGSRVASRLHFSIVLSYGTISKGGEHCSLALNSSVETDSDLYLLRPRQSYTMSGGKLLNEIRHHHPMLVAQWQEGVTRKDLAKAFSFREFKEYGGNLAILADRFLHEVAFKLWKAPKYGA